jgi:hypothetical protein
LKERKGGSDYKIGAIGDTESDFPMLIVASHGFLVSNSTPELKRKASNFGVKLLSSSFQSGLLEGVKVFLHENGREQCEMCNRIYRNLDNNSEPMWKICEVADMSSIQHWMRALDRHCFEIFKD